MTNLGLNFDMKIICLSINNTGKGISQRLGIKGSLVRASVWPHTFVEIYHVIISTLIQEGQMSVSGNSMCTKYWLTAYKG